MTDALLLPFSENVKSKWFVNNEVLNIVNPLPHSPHP